MAKAINTEMSVLHSFTSMFASFPPLFFLCWIDAETETPQGIKMVPVTVTCAE